MILADGVILGAEEQPCLLDELEDRINHTREKERLDTETVIAAIDQLGRRLAAGEFDGLIEAVGLGDKMEDLRSFTRLLSRDYLQRKVDVELGAHWDVPTVTEAAFGLNGTHTRAVPLGTLFHVAAGNMDFLPAYTVVEGLLTGNVNLLKLPQADGGATIWTLQKLIDIEPRLRHFLYVFDTPSSDVATLRRLAAMADGIVVWGGEEAVRAARSLAPPGVKLIEWGHRLSFAYLSGDWRAQTHQLTALANHIVRTEQLLCSSCQTIYLNTRDMTDIELFCEGFLPLLQAAREQHPMEDIGAAAAITLKNMASEIEAMMTGSAAEQPGKYRGRQCELTACEDSELTVSELFGRVWVKRLPEAQLLPVLRRQKGCLQTAGLLCDERDRERLTDLLIRCGVNRVTTPGGMSDVMMGESHDGEYALRRYIRMVNIEIPTAENHRTAPSLNS